MPRLSKYGEHVNDHQKEIVSVFKKEGFIKAVENSEELKDVLSNINEFIPKEYTSNTNNIIRIISEYIDKN